MDDLSGAITALRSEVLRFADEQAARSPAVAPEHAASARNLLHYLGLRRHDLRDLQDRLAAQGLSSLGRAEGAVVATLDAILARLGAAPAGTEAQPLSGKAALEHNTDALLGPRPPGRRVRIMVTMPSEAARDPGLVRALVEAGMDCMRINCAHDDEAAWAKMIAHLRAAEAGGGRHCRVLMDIAGPKLRTGPLQPGPAVVKWKPVRDVVGRVVAPARVWLTPAEAPEPPPSPAAATLPIDGAWLAAIAAGEQLTLVDAREKQRELQIVEAVGSSRWAESDATAYLLPQTRLSRAGGPDGVVGALPHATVPIRLAVGDRLLLLRAPTLGCGAGPDGPARIGCTLPELFGSVRAGATIWFDDGKIGGVVRAADGERLDVEITVTPRRGGKLGADKGINLPDTRLPIGALTAKDRADLAFVARSADLVGFSFVQSAEDVLELHRTLDALGGHEVGVVLKIETQRAFAELPRLLLAAMRYRACGVMIARGDLAIECGWQRLAEVQEEILWVAEAAHVPVIWATQVLESLARDGQPSRAEITDAAMGERAECVMLNKGPHCVDAVRTLDDILGRMEGHQRKKRSLLRPLALAASFVGEPARVQLRGALTAPGDA